MALPVPFGFRALICRTSPTAVLWKAKNQPIKLAEIQVLYPVVWEVPVSLWEKGKGYVHFFKASLYLLGICTALNKLSGCQHAVKPI